MRDESGVALGLAVIMIVLIGVMGAGLLVFVRNDLEAVVEVNQGEKAFNIADAGAQAAKQQILSDKTPGHYDVDDGSDCDSSQELPDLIGKNWGPVPVTNADGTEDQAGERRSFAGGQFDVTIQWLNQDPSADPSCIAPETTSSPEAGVDYFRVVSTGTSGDATRKVEAIYDTYNLDVPRAYFTPGEININGSACISQVSLFTLSDVTFAGGGNGCDGTGNNFEGEDVYYGDWNDPPSNEFNTTPRTDDAGNSVTEAGVGAAGEISGNPELSDGNPSEGVRDYDKSTTPKFVPVPGDPQDPNEITFPFDENEQLDGNRLCDEAKEQGNYTPDNSSGNATLSSWPADSSQNTVVCYEFTNSGSHVLTWAVDDTPDDDLTAEGYPDCTGPIQQGTLVVKGGGFTVKPNTDLFQGVVVVRGADATEGSAIEEEDAALGGKACLDGFINSTGPITIAGSVTPSSSSEVNDRPGFFGVRTWSWRELYE